MFLRIVTGALLLAALAAVWFVAPDDLLTVEGLQAVLAPLRSRWWGPLASTLAMATALLLFVPVTAIVAALVLVHGPAVGFVCGMVATLVSAAGGHSLGRFVLRDALGNQLARTLPRLGGQLRRRSLRPTLVLRLVPGPPFSLMNALAGSAGVPLAYFVAGTGLIALPQLTGVVWLSEGIIRAVQSPDPGEAVTWLVGAALLFGLLFLTSRWLRARPPLQSDERGRRK